MSYMHRGILFAVAFIVGPLAIMLCVRGCEAIDSSAKRAAAPWVVLGVVALLALRVLRGIRREWRAISVEPGHCAVCNYDLRASEDRCPECGHSFKLP